MQNQDSSVQEVQVSEPSTPTPSTQIQDLQNVCELPMDVASLQQQITLMDLEKQKILKALKSERAIRKVAEGEKKKLAREKDEVIRSLQQSLSQGLKDHHSQEAEIDTKKLLEEKDELICSLEQQLRLASANFAASQAEWESMFSAKVEEMSSKAKSLQDNHDKELRQVRLEKDTLVAQFTTNKNALEARLLECETKLQEKDMKHIQSEAEWTVTLTALEARMNTELAAKEASFAREGWQNKVCQMEETIKLLTEQNTNLQDRHLALQELQKDSSMREEELRQQTRQMEETIKLLTVENTSLQERYLSLQDRHLSLQERHLSLQEHHLSLQELQKDSSMKEEELGRQMRQMEESIKLLTKDKTDLEVRNLSLQELLKASSEKEEELRQKNGHMDETIKLLTQDNNNLQELAKKTDKEKAKMKKEEEKRLKKERKEREEREKKQRKEDEKIQKEELKRQKKETAEREKRERKETKEREKKEKQERKAKERRGE